MVDAGPSLQLSETQRQEGCYFLSGQTQVAHARAACLVPFPPPRQPWRLGQGRSSKARLGKRSALVLSPIVGCISPPDSAVPDLLSLAHPDQTQKGRLVSVSRDHDLCFHLILISPRGIPSLLNSQHQVFYSGLWTYRTQQASEPASSQTALGGFSVNSRTNVVAKRISSISTAPFTPYRQTHIPLIRLRTRPPPTHPSSKSTQHILGDPSPLQSIHR